MVHHGPPMPCSPYIALRARYHRVGYAYCYYQCVAPLPAHTATGPDRHTTAFAWYPRVPLPALMTAISTAAVLLASCAEVKWLGYVHAYGHCPSSLLVGPGDARVLPLSRFRGHRDTAVPP